MSEPTDTGAVRRRRVLATVLFCLALAEVVGTVVAGLVSGMSWTAGDNSLVISNSVNGLALAVAGWPIAAYRSRNPIGWLLLGGGCVYIASAAGYALLENATPADAHSPFWRLVAMVSDAAWAPAITFCLPIALLLFPDGDLPGRRFRWVVVVSVAATAVFVFGGLADVPQPAVDRGIHSYLFPGGPPVGWTYAVGGAGILVSWGAALVALLLRFRRAPQPLRRQLSWPLFALMLVFLSYIPNPVTANSVLGLLLTALIPISITIAIFRRQLFDIQLVFSRSLLYVLLTAGIVGAYLALVALADQVLGTRRTFGPSVIATIVIAAGFNPVRVHLQRAVDHAIYGARRDPVRAIAEVGARLGGVGTPSGAGLDAVLEALCEVMRLPSASITVHGTEVARAGDARPTCTPHRSHTATSASATWWWACAPVRLGWPRATRACSPCSPPRSLSRCTRTCSPSSCASRGSG